MTEERHPDQIKFWYTLTMNHIQVRHCFECTEDYQSIKNFLWWIYNLSTFINLLLLS